MEIVTKVKGTYFGVEFSGVIAEIWCWSDKFGRSGDDSFFVDLDHPIVVNGVGRKTLSVKPATGSIEVA